jgi:MoaA/NifB/PqqE/SkfB family radical SAM enzyme
LPNLVLTFDCHNSCEYCFADKAQNKALTFEQVTQLFSFVRSFNSGVINIVGGEPTLNKDFLSIVTFLLSQNQGITVFTNGNIHNKLIENLKLLSDNNLLFCVNRSQSKKTAMLTDFYRKLGYRIMLSVTIFRQNQKLQHIFEEINTYKLNKTYRLGIALPSWPEKSNQYINPIDYGEISAGIINYIEQGLNFGIKPSFDCGFPYCFFNDDQKRFLSRQEIDFKSNCGIIPDIYPDNTLVPCLPLKHIIQKFSNDSAWEEIRPLMENRFEQFKKLPLFEKCNSCDEVVNGNCSGGCAAFRMAT